MPLTCNSQDGYATPVRTIFNADGTVWGTRTGDTVIAPNPPNFVITPNSGTPIEHVDDGTGNYTPQWVGQTSPADGSLIAPDGTVLYTPPPTVINGVTGLSSQAGAGQVAGGVRVTRVGLNEFTVEVALDPNDPNMPFTVNASGYLTTV